MCHQIFSTCLTFNLFPLNDTLDHPPRNSKHHAFTICEELWKKIISIFLGKSQFFTFFISTQKLCIFQEKEIDGHQLGLLASDIMAYKPGSPTPCELYPLWTCTPYQNSKKFKRRIETIKFLIFQNSILPQHTQGPKVQFSCICPCLIMKRSRRKLTFSEKILKTEIFQKSPFYFSQRQCSHMILIK